MRGGQATTTDTVIAYVGELCDHYEQVADVGGSCATATGQMLQTKVVPCQTAVENYAPCVQGFFTIPDMWWVLLSDVGRFQRSNPNSYMLAYSMQATCSC